MEAEEVYAVSALVMSIVGAIGFVFLRFTDFGLTGILILGAAGFLTIVFVAAAAYEAFSSPGQGRSEIGIRERVSNVEWRSVARMTSYSIVAFALVGLGIGLTGAVAILELEGPTAAFLGSTLLVIVFAAAFIIGPVVALATGLGISDGALDGFLGAMVGFTVMVTLILVLLVLATSTATVGGETSSSTDFESQEDPEFGEPASTPTPEPHSSGSAGFWLRMLGTIVLFSIPTGFVGAGASVLKTRVG